MIGPEKGTVEVIPHYASWRYAFEQKRRVFRSTLRTTSSILRTWGTQVQARRWSP